MRRGLLAAILVATPGCELLVGLEDRQPHAVTIRGTVLNASFEPLEAVVVCLPDTGPDRCTTSDGVGSFALIDVPGRTLQRITFSSPSYFDAQLVIEVGDEDREIRMPLTPRALGTILLAPFGFDETQGLVGYFLSADASDPTNPGAEGFAVSLEPEGGYGPLQITEAAAVVDQVETTSTGIGAFINLPEGSYTLLTEGEGNCAPDAPSAALEAGVFLVPIDAGRITMVLAECKPFL